MTDFEVGPDEFYATVLHYDTSVLICIVTEEGPAGVASKERADALFKYKCVQDKLGQLTKHDLIITWVVRGTQLHQNFLDLFRIATAPFMIIVNRKMPSSVGLACVPLTQTDCYSVLVLNNAISRLLEGGSKNTREQKLLYDKYVDASQNDSSLVADEGRCEVTVFNSGNNTSEVGVQCHARTTLSVRQSDVHTSQDSDLVINETTNRRPDYISLTEPVWLIDKTAALPTDAVSRLQIVLPNSDTLHVAVTGLATLQDIQKIVSLFLAVPSNSLEISRRYPYHTFLENEMLGTIEQLNLVPSAVLLIKMTRPTCALLQPDRTLTGVVLSIVAAIAKPLWAGFARFWIQIRNIFYSTTEEVVEVCTDDDSEPDIPTTSR